MNLDSRIYSDEMIEHMKLFLDNNATKFITYPKFVFVCGKAFSSIEDYNKSNRGVIDKYLTTKSKDVFIVLSEKLWEDSFDSNIGMEFFKQIK